MIDKQEIMDFAHEFSLPVNTIEKDYVLGWLLAGIANEIPTVKLPLKGDLTMLVHYNVETILIAST